MSGARDGAPDDPPPFAPFEVVSSERIYDSPWVGLRRDVVRPPTGADSDYHVVEISDAVAVVPALADGGVVLIGQYRYPHGRTHWEIPAGRLHGGEAPLDAAARELLEETGYRARRFEALPGFYPVNGISAHFAHLYAALDCERVADPAPEHTEQLLVRTFTRREIERLIDAGRVRDGFAALGLLYWLRRSG